MWWPTTPASRRTRFWGFCTLATCKPVIRRTATIGDWVVGISPKRRGNRVVFAMLVDEILDYVSYYRDHRFACKIPVYSKNGVIWKAGDNIYKPLANGTFRQLRSMHSRGERENPQTKAHDLSGENILIAKKFHYFGASGPELPLHLTALKVAGLIKTTLRLRQLQILLILLRIFPRA